MTASLIAIASGKGGVGKTFVSIALSQACARAGERVLLVDGDLGLANIDVQLGLQPPGDLLSVVSGAKPIEAAIAPFEGGSGRGGFDLLAGRSGSGALRALPAHDVEALAHGMKLTAAGYDRTFVDLAAGIDDQTLDLAAACSRILVVLTDEPTSLTDAYALIKVVSQQRQPAPAVGVVVNMAANDQEGRATFAALERACQRFLGFAPTLAGIVPRDARVREAIRAQMPYLTRFPSGLASDALTRLARSLDAAFSAPGSSLRQSRLR